MSVQWDVSPLFSHWRHRPVVSVRKGCSPPKATITAPPTFCTHSEALENTLRPLHQRLRAGERQYQAEIDRYLIAVVAPEFAHLVLPRSAAPHYDNLPDLSQYALGILDPSKDLILEVQQIFLMLRQCTPLRRRTKRAQRELQWRRESMRGMQVLVRSMQGTLLGLYPSCARPIAFATRVEVFRFLRALLVAEFETLNACMHRVRYIVKICVMEHLCNTIADYQPGLYYMLNKSGQQMGHFTHAVATMCDIFRSELNQLHATHGTLLRALPHLEKSAHSFFERCTRAYRGIITNQNATVSSVEHLRKHPLTPSMEFVAGLDRIYACKSQYIFDLVHGDMQDREAAWHVSQIVRVHQLPPCIKQRQLLALRRRYEHDTLCIERCRRVHTCVYCAAKRGGAGSKMRYDCVTGELVCVQCNIPSILEIDVLGRLAQVGDQTLLLTCCCASLVYYTGSGHEFGTECGPHCARQNQMGRPRVAPEPPPAPPTCHVCHQRNVAQTLDILVTPLRAMQRFGLCPRHQLHPDVTRTVCDDYDLTMALTNNARPSALTGH